MESPIQVCLFGSLQKEGVDCKGGARPFPLKRPSPLVEVLNLLQIPEDRVQLAMVNHRTVSWDHVVFPGDRVSLFPKEYALFADWKDLRTRHEKKSS